MFVPMAVMKRADGVAGKGRDAGRRARRSGSCRAAPGMACVLRSRACLALPPAESPSTMKISDSSGFWTSSPPAYPGRANESSTPLRRVISRALRAASQAFRACVALPMMRLAGAGFSSRYSAKPCVTAFWTSGRISGIAELRLRLTLELAVVQLHGDDGAKPSRVSSPERLLSFSFRMPLLRAYSLMVRVTACLKPSRCVPPRAC